jgi:proteasome lid subunit RPN8/RPN11
MRLAEASVELIGQVHSHPGRFIDHSDGDDDRAFMPYEGFISLVVPDHARSGMIPLSTCGVHIFEHGRFRRLSDAEVISSFHVVDAFVDLR